ncbi:MAG: B12-binding domain-containing radical SAM protein [Chloroflexi bacterium]|nr:B12-binding domain-containing radical SAM protein [Chloroflexota bacterium]
MIVLYNPPSSAGRKPVLPMSLLALGAVLEGIEPYVIVDGNLERDPEAAIERAVRDQGADILGVTVMPGPQLADATALLPRLKARHPGLTVVWGGYFPTQHFEVCLREPAVDWVIRGHGERTFVELVQRLRAGKDPQDLPGLAFRDAADGSIRTTGTAHIPHPNELPDFPYHAVDMARYPRRTFMGARTIAHHSSYGCPFFCNFCAVVNMVGGRWLSQSAERTAAVTERLVREWGVDAVEFYDNNFFVHEARTAEFAERIKPLGIGWWGESRIDTMLRYSDRTWELMRDSGLRMVFLGAESGSDETLKRMNKGGTASTAKTLEIAAKMRGYGIVPEMSFVMGNPPDPEADAESTMAFIRRVKEVNPATEVILYLYTPVPLSGELYEQAKAEGFAFPETLAGWVSDDWQEFAQRRSAVMPWLKDPLRRRLKEFEWVLNARYPTATDLGITPARRRILQVAAAWRYRLGVYAHPVELRALQRLLPYRRPETSGF